MRQPSNCCHCARPFRNPEPAQFKFQGHYEWNGGDYCTGCWQAAFYAVANLTNESPNVKILP